FDEVLQPEPDTGRLLTIALSILGLVIVRGLLDMTNSWSVETLGQRMERDAREELYISLLGKSQTFHNRQRVGDIMARATNDVNQLNPVAGEQRWRFGEMNAGLNETISGIEVVKSAAQEAQERRKFVGNAGR